MNEKKAAGGVLFGGFDGVGIGMMAAGIRHKWSIEYDAAIAAVAQQNGFNTIVADIIDCNPEDFEPVNFLHASPHGIGNAVPPIFAQRLYKSLYQIYCNGGK